MFEYMNMINNYEQRAVAHNKVNEAVIDTCAVSDSSQPYETGIAHPRYNDGKWIIVQLYPTKKAAQQGHKKWMGKFSRGLPKQLKDISDCDVIQTGKVIFGENNFGGEIFELSK